MKTNKTKSAKRVSTKPYHHGDMRAAILKQSVRLLREQGPQGFNMSDIAKKLKVSGAAPYRHFKSKEQIFFRIAEDGFRRLTEVFKNRIAVDPLNPEAQLLGASLGYFEFALGNPEHLQLMFGNAVSIQVKQADHALNAAATETFLTLISIVRNCQLVQVLPPAEASERLAIKIWSVMHGYSVLESSGTIGGTLHVDYDREEVAREIFQTLMAGLRN